jgi:hypothetical protein
VKVKRIRKNTKVGDDVKRSGVYIKGWMTHGKITSHFFLFFPSRNMKAKKDKKQTINHRRAKRIKEEREIAELNERCKTPVSLLKGEDNYILTISISQNLPFLSANLVNFHYLKKHSLVRYIGYLLNILIYNE